MTSFEELKKQILAAEKEASSPQNCYQNTARLIVNIERQAYYGDESENKRLSRIREVFSNEIKKKSTNEA